MISVKLSPTPCKYSQGWQTKSQNYIQLCSWDPSLMGRIKDWELNSATLLIQGKNPSSVASLSFSRWSKRKQTQPKVPGSSWWRWLGLQSPRGKWAKHTQCWNWQLAAPLNISKESQGETGIQMCWLLTSPELLCETYMLIWLSSLFQGHCQMLTQCVCSHRQHFPLSPLEWLWCCSELL